MSERPLIVSAVLDPETTERLEALRRAHFPPERLVVGAHLTLFHHLPGEQEARVRGDLERAAGERIAARVSRVRSLGRGVAYDVEAPELVALRARLAEGWSEWLTPQDRNWGRPHVTVQNKVEPDVARATLAGLEGDFEPWETEVEALALWRYAGGPWEPVARVELAPP